MQPLTAAEALEEAAKIALTVYGDTYTPHEMSLEWNQAKSRGEFEAASRIAHSLREKAKEMQK